jgi:hypothetical protein
VLRIPPIAAQTPWEQLSWFPEPTFFFWSALRKLQLHASAYAPARHRLRANMPAHVPTRTAHLWRCRVDRVKSKLQNWYTSVHTHVFRFVSSRRAYFSSNGQSVILGLARSCHSGWTASGASRQSQWWAVADPSDVGAVYKLQQPGLSIAVVLDFPGPHRETCCVLFLEFPTLPPPPHSPNPCAFLVPVLVVLRWRCCVSAHAGYADDANAEYAEYADDEYAAYADMENAECADGDVVLGPPSPPFSSPSQPVCIGTPMALLRLCPCRVCRRHKCRVCRVCRRRICRVYRYGMNATKEHAFFL